MRDHLTASQRICAWRLTEGRPVSNAEMVHALYGQRSDGGALNANNVVSQFMVYVIKFLKQNGIKISNHYYVGYSVDASDLDKLRSVLADEIARNHSFEPRRPAKQEIPPYLPTQRTKRCTIDGRAYSLEDIIRAIPGLATSAADCRIARTPALSPENQGGSHGHAIDRLASAREPV